LDVDTDIARIDIIEIVEIVEIVDYGDIESTG
jgi:hypothetical protein